MKPHPVAVLCADIHLSLSAPVWRSAETDWFQAMARPLDELSRFAKKHAVPILCAGDIFDKWNPPPELINFAIEHLPEMYAVPGQHDLPYHIDEDMDRSAFGTMVRIGRVRLLRESPTLIRGAWVYGYGWGTDIASRRDADLDNEHLHIAIVHKYVWQHKASYPGAPVAAQIKCLTGTLGGYDVAVFGDNHIGFARMLERENDPPTNVLNCGGFMRRKSDEINRRPGIGLLYSDSSIWYHKLDTSKDLYIDSPEVAAQEQGEAEIEDFVRELSTLNSDTFDFPASIRHYIEGRKETLAPGVRRLLLDVITQ